MKKLTSTSAVLAMTLASQFASAALIYQQPFTGSSASSLTGTAVTTGSGFWGDQTGRFKLDGSVAGVWYSAATLSFAPTAGNIYTMQATLNATTGNEWTQLYMGFFNASGGDSTTINSSASAWMGMDDSGHWFVNGGHEGTTVLGPITFKIVLDTTETQWKSKFYVGDFYVSWKDQTFTTNPTISTVGFGTQENTGGTISNFSLNVVPEPSTYFLMSGGIAMLLLNRRRTVY